MSSNCFLLCSRCFASWLALIRLQAWLHETFCANQFAKCCILWFLDLVHMCLAAQEMSTVWQPKK